MKKIILISLAVFAVLFLLITVMKNQPSKEESKLEGSSYSALEKENSIKFWEQYRAATKYRMDDQWEQAAEYYQKALELNPVHEDALYYMGNMNLELSKYREAEQYWQKLIQVNPGNTRAYQQLGTLYLDSEELFDIDKAESACQEALKLNKEETGPVLLLGEVKLIRGDLDAAAADFESVTASNFKSTEAYFLGGYIAWKKGDTKKARALFSQAVQYAKPVKKGPQEVMGEGDTKKGRGFGAVTSKSVFRDFMTDLPSIQLDQANQSLEKTYKSLDLYMLGLKRRVH